MPDICASQPTNPARLIADAINAAFVTGIHVTAGPDPGIILVSRNPPKWDRDPAARGVSPLGAVVLERQPPIADLELAISNATSQGIPYCAGFEDGCAGFAQNKTWQATPAVRLYNEGYYLGAQMRVLVSTQLCTTHGRRFQRGTACPQCAAAEDVTQVSTVPGRPTAELEREALRRLMAHAKTSDVLEVLADICRDRANADGGGIVGDRAVNNAVTEAELRGIARDLRSDKL